MKRYAPSRALVRGTAPGRLAPRVAGSPRFNPQRPIGAYARRLPGPKPPRRPWVEFDSDAFFAFVLVALILFAGSLGTAGAAAISAMMLIYGMIRLPQLGQILAPRLFILIIPIFAVFSTFWSQLPSETLKYSLEFALTVGVGLTLSAAPQPKAVLWGVFLAFAIYVPIALAFGQAVDVGNNGEMASSGLSQSKNLLGDIASSGALVSLACFVASIEDRRPFRALLALGIAAIESYALIEARSAGALLGMLPAVAAFIFFLALRPARLVIRLFATVFASLTAAVAAIAYGNNVVADGITLFDKDPTLTGRTYLWQRAADFIAEKPVLGTGFNAFWVQGNPDAEGLWRYAGIVTRWGFRFHNTVVETLVNLGWLGLFVLGTVAVASVVLLVRRVMTRPTLAACFWLSVVVYEFVRMPIEAIGMAPFSHATVLLFAAFGSALAARQTAAARAATRHMSYRVGPLRPAFHQRGGLQPGGSSP
jgi:exopolysaccharide production protein ExoQ